MRASKQPYAGIDKDIDGGMTVAGRIIRDTRAFGIIPETETGEGWTTQRLEGLWNQTHTEWEKYRHSVNRLQTAVEHNAHGIAMPSGIW